MCSDKGEYCAELVGDSGDVEHGSVLRLVRTDSMAWERKMGWTPLEFNVSDNGTVLLYGNLEASIVVQMIDKSGALLRDDIIKRESVLVDGPRLPEAASNIVIHSAMDVGLFRVNMIDQRRPSPWWAFRLSTGERQPDVEVEYPIELDPDKGLFAREMRAIGTTGLTLCHWWLTDYSPDSQDWFLEGAVFSLADLKGHSVWSVTLPDDYTDNRGESATRKLKQELRSSKCILSSGPGNTFALWYVKPHQRVEYRVEPSPGQEPQWRVVETSRAPIGDGIKSSGDSVSSTSQGEHDARTKVTSERGAGSSGGDIVGLGFADDGCPEVIQQNRSGTVRYVRLTSKGIIEERKELCASTDNGIKPRAWHDLAGDTWLVQYFDKNTPWLMMDIKGGEKRPIDLPSCGAGCSLAGDKGGWMALCPLTESSVVENELIRVDEHGRVAWRVRQSDNVKDFSSLCSAVYSARGMALGRGQFTLLLPDRLESFDLDRRHVGTIDLRSPLQRADANPTTLLADSEQGFYIDDGEHIHHLDKNGKHISSLVIRGPTGIPDRSLATMLRVAPDGALWTSDGCNVLRLNASGSVELVIEMQRLDGR